MNGNPKVVHLNQARGSGDNTSTQLNLPLPLIKLRDEMGEQLKSLLRQLFDNTDDALFELADRAANNSEQSLYFEAMREIRLKRPRLEGDFLQSYGKAFANLGAAVAKAQVTQDFTMDSLSLVRNDELEEQVAIDNMVTKVKNRWSTELQHLTIRIDSLMGNLSISSDQNPLGPRVLVEAFVNACKALEADIRAKLVVMKLFDKFVLSRMQDVLDAANKSLIEQGVMPDLKVVRPAQKSRNAPVYRNQPAPGYRQPTTVDANTGQVLTDSGNPEVFGFLQELLAEQRAQGAIPTLMPLQGFSAAGGQGGAGAANLPVLAQTDLVALLSNAQRQAPVNPAFGAQGGLVDLRALLQGLVAQGGQAKARVGQLDEDVINLVSMLFEFILDDRQLPPTMKALIARLQIPMLKVAIIDQTFFSKNGHPARRLLNELATTAIGWNEKPAGEADPLRDKIEGIVQRLINDFSDDLSVFDEILQDFTKFTDNERRRGQLVEQRTRDSEEGKAKSEVARRQVQDTLNEALAGRSVPEAVIKLLRDGWSNVLTLIYLKQGSDNEDWRNAVNLAKDLVWSVNPPIDRSARRQLLQMIPTLLKGLREGLSTTSFSPFEMDKLLKELEGFHMKALQRMSARAVPAVPAPAAPVAKQAAPAAPATSPATDEGSVEPQPPVILIDADQAPTPVATVADAEPAAKETTRPVAPAAESPISSLSEPLVVAEEIVLVAPVEDLEESSAAVDAACLARVDQLRPGCWVEFHEEAGKKYRCKLAAFIQTTGKYIFVNRTGVKVAEKTRLGLAGELSRGGVSLLDDGLLFDRALEAVIGNLRTNK